MLQAASYSSNVRPLYQRRLCPNSSNSSQPIIGCFANSLLKVSFGPIRKAWISLLRCHAILDQRLELNEKPHDNQNSSGHQSKNNVGMNLETCFALKKWVRNCRNLFFVHEQCEKMRSSSPPINQSKVQLLQSKHNNSSNYWASLSKTEQLI